MTRTQTRYAAVALAALLLSAPAARAQDETDEGMSMMERGAQMFFDGLRSEMQPALDELRTMAEEMGPALREFVETMGPALAEVLGEVEDLSTYHAPEMLPNGDIIMRKKHAEDTPPPEDGPSPLPMQPLDEGEVDL